MFDNGFKLQLEACIRYVVEGAPYQLRLGRSAKGVQLVVRASELEGAPLGRRAGPEDFLGRRPASVTYAVAYQQRHFLALGQSRWQERIDTLNWTAAL